MQQTINIISGVNSPIVLTVVKLPLLGYAGPCARVPFREFAGGARAFRRDPEGSTPSGKGEARQPVGVLRRGR
jgi:hypothetical protein